MAPRVVGILVGHDNVIQDVCRETKALPSISGAGYAAATVDLTEHLKLPMGSSLQDLAHLALPVLSEALPGRHRLLVDERYWYLLVVSDAAMPALADVPMQSTRAFDFAAGWDGAVICGDVDGCAMAEQTITRALIHWYAVGSLGTQARSASASGDGRDHQRIRNELEKAALLLDPRIDVYWEDEHDLLDVLRTTWRTTEMEVLTTRVVNSLEYLISNRRARRLESIVLLFTVTSLVALLPMLIEFSSSDSPSIPRNIARAAIAATLLVTIFVAWWRLRER